MRTSRKLNWYGTATVKERRDGKDMVSAAPLQSRFRTGLMLAIVSIFGISFWPVITAGLAQTLPGTPLPNTSAFSDQKLGSVLVYNLYSSSATNPAQANTDFSITNTNTTTAATVQLFFVNSANARAANNFISLAPRQTMSFLASDYDPGITGYMVAVAVDSATGCPISFNHLMGDAYVKLSTGHAAGLGAVAFSALYEGAIGSCSGGTAVLNFDDNPIGAASYNRVPRAVMMDNVPSRSDGNDTLLVLNRFGGNFTQGGSASTLGAIFGIAYDDRELAYSFSVTGGSQLRGSISNTFPRLTPRFGLVVPFGRTSWLKLWSPADIGVLGAMINHNAGLGANAAAGVGGHNLRALSLASTATLTVPVISPSTQTDLAVAIAHAGDFNTGSTGAYTVTVNNIGTKQATGTITVYDVLPTNLTLASGVGTGWSCSGAGTANVACSNVSGLAASASLPPLTLTVNVGAGTPNPVVNTVTVVNAGDNNPGNDQATDTANVTAKTPTTTAAVTSAPNPANVGQPITYTATVTGAGGTPTGTVEFFVTPQGFPPVSRGTGTLNGSGVAMVTDLGLGAALYGVSAVYSGDATFAGSSGAAAAIQQVNIFPRNATTTALVSSVNPTALGQGTTFTATVTSGAGTPNGNVEFYDGATLLATRTLSGGIATLSGFGSLAAGTHAIAARYLGDPVQGISTSPVVNQVVTQTDVGAIYPPEAEFSDQKTGSVLIYNFYSSGAASSTTQNTDISITNTNTTAAATVRLFFVNSANGRASDTFLSIAPNQTISFLASDYDPGITGYLVAVAVDGTTGCPVSFNHLIGDAYIKLPSGHRAALQAQAVSALYTGTLPAWNGFSPTVTLAFNGFDYNLLPGVLTVDNVPARAQGNDTLLVLNRIGGSFVQGQSVATVGSVFGLLYDDVENVFSFSLVGGPQLRGSLSNTFPRLTPRYENIIPPGRSGWLKMWSSNVGIMGATLNFNGSAATQANAFNSGRNLRALTLTPFGALIVPVSAPNTQTDLAIGVTHEGDVNTPDFSIGSQGRYNVTVTNVGTKQATGTITVFDTLPANLTLASFSGAGWTCAGTVNVACTNISGLAPSASLPPLTLLVNVGAATPDPVSNTAIVANAGDNNALNDQATAVANVRSKTPSSVALSASPASSSDAGQAVTFSATVSGSGGTPTGIVEFLSLTPAGVQASLGTASLSAGVAALTTSTLPVNLYTITAVYRGDASFGNSRNSILHQVNLSPRNATTTALTSFANPSLLGQTISFTATVTSGAGTPAGNVQFFNGATSLGIRTLGGAGTATLLGVVLNAGTHPITAQYLGDPNFAPSASPVLNQAANQADVGAPYPASAESSDQRTGSVLVYNLYSSDAANPATENTDISLTNTNPTTPVTAHLFFVRGATGAAADRFVTLAPNQTLSFLASEMDPGARGYLIAVAVDAATGCPVSHNFLMGDAYLKLATGARAALQAEAFAALYSGALAGCAAGSTSATIDFDGVSYSRLPRAVEIDSILSRADNNTTLLALNRIGGNLSFGSGARTIGDLFGVLFDDIENAFTWTSAFGSTQITSDLSNSFPVTTPDFETILPAGRSGWMKFWSTSAVGGLLGASINRNPNAGTQAFAFNNGRNLHHLTLADPAALTIPVYPPSAGADLSIAKTHSGDFLVGGTGNYSFTVSNAPGGKPATGTITITDTLPSNLKLASFSGAGWNCAGTGTANVVCSNASGLAAGASLPALTITVNVNTGTPPGTNSITNTATVSIAPPQDLNPANNTASDPTTINTFEADAAPRPNGDGRVLVSDWVQVGRFSVGLDTPAPGSERQRADCAPRATLGDGLITVADWVQAGRYSVGLDPLIPAGGQSQFAMVSRADSERQGIPRELRVASRAITTERGFVTVPVELAALGGENGVAFSLQYDSSVLSYQGYVRGGDASASITLLAQIAQAKDGRLGFGLALAPGDGYPAGVRELLRVRFKVLRMPDAGTEIRIGDGPAAFDLVDANAERLSVKPVHGTLRGTLRRETQKRALRRGISR